MEKTPKNPNGICNDDGSIQGEAGATLIVMPGVRWLENFFRDLKDGTITRGAFVYCKKTKSGEEEVCYRIIGGEAPTFLSGLALRLAIFLGSSSQIFHSDEIMALEPDINKED